MKLTYQNDKEVIIKQRDGMNNMTGKVRSRRKGGRREGWYVHGHGVEVGMGDRIKMGNMKNGSKVHGSVPMLQSFMIVFIMMTTTT